VLANADLKSLLEWPILCVDLSRYTQLQLTGRLQVFVLPRQIRKPATGRDVGRL